MVAVVKSKRFQGHSPVFPGQKLWRNLRIGLLGGSFNPAHEGHVHISLHAMKRLNLDWVWWLVSPQNPLKDNKNLAPLSKRIADAEKLTNSHPNIHVSDIETHFGTNKTIDTLRTLKTACPENQFIWLMGADNMVQFDQWASWQDIAELLPIAIMDRSGYSTKALQSKFARRYAHLRVTPQKASKLGVITKIKTAPEQGKGLKLNNKFKPANKPAILKQNQGLGWVFLPCPKHLQSSSNIRNLTNPSNHGTTSTSI
jgi:nicotinate-nucleotide adenylyltransferase